MCGRYVFADFDHSGVLKYFEIPQLKLKKSYNIAPGTEQMVVTRNSPNAGHYMKWGFKPSWFSKPGGLINARSETVYEKPLFKKAFETSRCLIPASGFYEWARVEKEKIPYYIHLKNKQFFAFAGIYDHHTDAGGRDHYSFAILTTSPNEIMEPIHNRMPVILFKEDHNMWLDKKTPIPVLKQMLVPYADVDAMEAYPISRRVNSPENDDEGLCTKLKI